MERRTFLKNTAKVAGAGAVSTLVNSTFAQAWYGRSPSLLGEPKGNRVVIVGGGWGGITTARHLMRSGADVEVVLIEQKSFFMSCPMSNLYLAGAKPLDFITFEYTNAVAEGMIFINERALEVDRDSKVVTTGAGDVAYDYLVLSPGIDYMPETIEGFSESAHLLPVGFKPFEHIALRRQLEVFEGGDLVISIPKPPYRCPPGPYERVAMLAWMLQHNEIPGKVIVLDANNEPLAKKDGFLAAYDELYSDIVEYYPNAEVIGINYEAKTLQTKDFGEFDFDLANVIPQMQAGDIVRKAGLGERWANVAVPFFISESDENVYLLGDITGNTPFPKSGMVANTEGRIVAAHIAQRLEGKSLDEIEATLPGNICHSFVNGNESIWVSASYYWNADTQEIDRDSGLDVQRSETNGIQALAWAESLWTDMFGPSISY